MNKGQNQNPKIQHLVFSKSKNDMFAGIGKPIFDCDTLNRYKKPPCGVFQTHGAHIWVSMLANSKNYIFTFKYCL